MELLVRPSLLLISAVHLSRLLASLGLIFKCGAPCDLRAFLLPSKLMGVSPWYLTRPDPTGDYTILIPQVHTHDPADLRELTMQMGEMSFHLFVRVSSPCLVSSESYDPLMPILQQTDLPSKSYQFHQKSSHLIHSNEWMVKIQFNGCTLLFTWALFSEK